MTEYAFGYKDFFLQLRCLKEITKIKNSFSVLPTFIYLVKLSPNDGAYRIEM